MGTSVEVAPASTTSPGNGVVTQQKRDRAVALLLGGCILSVVLIAGASILTPPSQWDLVNRAMDMLESLTLLLVGGLLGTTIPTRKA
jgi:hypothetical protein